MQSEKFTVAIEPGITLLKAGTLTLHELEDRVGIPGLRSQIADVPVCMDELPITAGRFAMQESVDFPYMYTYTEVKVVVSGKIIVRDEAGTRYVGEPGDVFIFRPGTLVVFDKESDGTAVYVGHRTQDPDFS